mgnify:CR=1 FL=1
MYALLLIIHSWFRWLVLASLVYAIYKSCSGWFNRQPFTPFDNSVRHVTATLLHVQFVIGIVLYFISPVVDYFLHNFGTAIHERDIRFFGMEHVTMMFIAVAVISAGSMKARRIEINVSKFKTMAIWYSIGLVIIFLSIPWEFSPFTSRPYFRF